MKLYEACDIGYNMGLETIGECVDNICVHSLSLFDYDYITDELQELFREVEAAGYVDGDSVALVLGEERMVEIDDEIDEWTRKTGCGPAAMVDWYAELDENFDLPF